MSDLFREPTLDPNDPVDAGIIRLREGIEASDEYELVMDDPNAVVPSGVWTRVGPVEVLHFAGRNVRINVRRAGGADE